MPFLKVTWKKIKPVIINKYVIVGGAFLIFMTFFDEHNLLQRWEIDHNIKVLQKEYNYYKNKIDKDKEDIQKLQNDSTYLEKFAREKYHMKSKKEDIFIIKK